MSLCFTLILLYLLEKQRSGILVSPCCVCVPFEIKKKKNRRIFTELGMSVMLLKDRLCQCAACYNVPSVVLPEKAALSHSTPGSPGTSRDR